MSEMNLSTWRSQGGSHVATDFMGNHIAALAGRYVPGLDANENGDCSKATVDQIESMIRLMRNAPQVYVFKDSNDTSLQFSVKPFDFWLGSILCSFAGQLAVSGLSAGNLRYIWADLANAPTVTIGVGAAWPSISPRYLRLAAITAPASGPWLPENMVSHVAPQVGRSPGKQLLIYEKDFTFASGATVAIETVPLGTRIMGCGLQIDTLFNGSPNITIGDSGNNSRFMTNGVAIPGTAGFKKNIDLAYKYAAQGTPNIYIGGSGVSAGVATAFIWALT